MIRCAFASVESERGMPSHRLALSAPLCSCSFLICSQFARTASTLVGPDVPEDMGMAADHLLGDRAEDGGDVEFARLFGHPRDKEYLKEEIAELFLERRGSSPVDRLEDLVGLLDEVAGHVRLRPGAVPGAAVGRSQPDDEVEQFPEFLFGAAGGLFQT